MNKSNHKDVALAAESGEDQAGMKRFHVPTATSVVPGYSEQRRMLVIGAPGALALLLSSKARLAAALDEAMDDDDLDRFIVDTADRAVALKADASPAGQDEYVRFIEEAVAVINDVSSDPLSDKSWKDFDPGVYLGDSGRNRAFFVVQWHLDPGAFLPPHCHPVTSVCTLGLDGDATLRHFEPGPDAPSYRDDRETDFLVRETRRLRLTSGVTSTLTAQRDNIHLFEAGPVGARGIDVTTDYGGDGTFSFLEFDRHTPEDISRSLYRARWIGTDL